MYKSAVNTLQPHIESKIHNSIKYQWGKTKKRLTLFLVQFFFNSGVFLSQFFLGGGGGEGFRPKIYNV